MAKLIMAAVFILCIIGIIMLSIIGIWVIISVIGEIRDEIEKLKSKKKGKI